MPEKDVKQMSLVFPTKSTKWGIHAPDTGGGINREFATTKLKRCETIQFLSFSLCTLFTEHPLQEENIEAP